MTWTLPKPVNGGDYCLALSPDGKVLYHPNYTLEIRRSALETAKELPPIPDLHNRAVLHPHPDGKTLFAVSHDRIRRWDVASGKETSRDVDFIDWHTTAMSSDGRWFALRGSQNVWDGVIELCNTESKKVERIAWPWGNGTHIAFTADSRSLIVNAYYHLQFLTVPKLAKEKKVGAARKWRRRGGVSSLQSRWPLFGGPPKYRSFTPFRFGDGQANLGVRRNRAGAFFTG